MAPDLAHQGGPVGGLWDTGIFLASFFQAQMDAERAFGEQQEREHPHRFGGPKFGIGTVLRGFT